MWSVLAESSNFIVQHEYEVVSLLFKKSKKDIVIGDFYGDPVAAVVSNDERFVVMVGCGIIIYYLQKPFKEFKYNMNTEQWKELFREPGKVWWIDNVEVIDDNTVRFTVDELDAQNGGTYELNVYSTQLRKCV